MLLHQKVFYFICFFLGGVLLASLSTDLGGRFLLLISASILVATFLGFAKKTTLAILSVGLILGGSYYFAIDQASQSNFSVPINEKISINLLVKENLIFDSYQRIDGQLQGQYQGNIRLYAPRYPQINYGDVISFSAKLESINPEAVGYFKKEGIFATTAFPKDIKIIQTNQGSKIKAVLYGIRGSVQASLAATLKPEQATFMSGLLIGKSAGFSKDFQEKLRATGTTHLIALSGYNVTIIASMMLFLFVGLAGRRRAFWLAIGAILVFVVMTGAEASVVRAGIMASLIFLAEHVGRQHSLKNAIAVAAFIMVLVNPLVLVFDIGFQLSFLAFLGIAYVQPALSAIFNPENKKGVLLWRENLLTTLAAQIAVLPLLLANFGYFAPISLLTNILILTFIPHTMLLGFLLFITYQLLKPLVIIFVLPAKLFLGYEIGIINFFSNFSFAVSTQSFPFILTVIYYLGLLAFLIYARRNYGKLSI